MQPFLDDHRLLLDGKRGIVKHSVGEVFLTALLHLDNENLTFFVLAEDIEDGTPLVLFQAEHLDIAERDINDHFLADHLVQKTDDKIFADFTAEYLFPAVIGEGVDKFVHN